MSKINPAINGKNKQILCHISCRIWFIAFFISIFEIFAAVSEVKAQGVGINPFGNPPDASAMLDIVSTEKGLLIPRVGLTSTTSNAPIGAGVATSLLVYNTATINDLVPGFYYWNGSKWVPIKATSSNNSSSIQFPDGIDNITPITVGNLSANPYTVPAGKNLYIVSYYSKGSTGSENLKIDAATVYGYYSNEAGYAIHIPIVAAAGNVISSTNTAISTSFNGFLVDATVTPVTVGNLSANPYTVPAGKTLFIINYYSKGSTGSEALIIDGATIFGYYSNEAGYAVKIPIIAGTGSVVSSTNTATTTSFNGYLK